MRLRGTRLYAATARNKANGQVLPRVPFCVRKRLEKVRAHDRPTRYVVLDFRQVIGLDSTALPSFDKMRQMARDQGFILVLSGLPAAMRRQFARGEIDEEEGVLRFVADFDRAAEWCEDQLCAGARSDAREKALSDYLESIIPRPSTLCKAE